MAFTLLLLVAGILCLIHTSIQQDAQKVVMTSNGISRTYWYNLPPNFDATTPTPVILSYHGGARTATSQMALDQLWNPEFNDFAITAYPVGIKESWQGVPGDTINDVLFTSDILANLTEKFTLDTSRIYATGKSDGAGFNSILACDPTLSSIIAAFAPVSGAFYQTNTSACVPETVPIACNSSRTNIPFLEFHGGMDTTINYEGGARNGECLPSIPYFITQWALRDELGSTNTSSELAGTDDVTIYTFGDGLVTHYFDSSIGHDWPSTVPNADNEESGHVLASYNATPIVIDWFNRWSLAGQL